MTIFTAAAVLALVIGPTCGGVPADSDLARHLVATVMTESAGDQYAIGVNADPARNLPAGRASATTAGEAVEKAAALSARGRHIDLGLAQISDRQLARHHLTLATAFDDARTYGRAPNISPTTTPGFLPIAVTTAAQPRAASPTQNAYRPELLPSASPNRPCRRLPLTRSAVHRRAGGTSSRQYLNPME